MAFTHLGISPIVENQGAKELTANEAFALLEALQNTGVISSSLNTPPISPANGDTYIVGPIPTGSWTGKTLNIAYFYSPFGWRFIVPRQGVLVYSIAAVAYQYYTGSVWVDLFTLLSFLSKLGINTTADNTNKLSVNSAAILFNNIGNSVQVKVNKNATADSGTFLFQKAFSGRAEIGLAGNDDFAFKTSPDGSTFTEALVLSNTAGRAAFGKVFGALVATGTTQGTALAISGQVNDIGTTPAASGVILPTPFRSGDYLIVANSGANSLNVYPQSGANFSGSIINAPKVLLTGKTLLCISMSATSWITFLSA